MSPATRPLRFAVTGGTAVVAQLAVLALLTRHGWNALLAAAALLIAAQVNFILSLTLTWRDLAVTRSIWQHWLLFHASISVMALANVVTFALTRAFLPTLAASLAGIAVGSVGNYLLGDRLVFRGRAGRGSKHPTRRFAA